METPADSRSRPYLESSTLKGALIIPAICFDQEVRTAHEKYGIRFWAELRIEDDGRLQYDIADESPYNKALEQIRAEEQLGDIDEGSQADAIDALTKGTFEETGWADYLPEITEK